MADVRPETEMKALGDDFAAAEPDDPWLRCSLAPAIGHLSGSLEGTGKGI